MGWAKNIGGLFSGSTGKNAGNDAFNQLQASQNQATGYLNPYNQAGQQALSPLTELLTGSSYDPKTGQSTQLSQDQRNNLLYQSPGYQFSLDQALKAMNSSFAAKGNLLSGGATKEIGEYASGYAAKNSSDYINQLFQLMNGGLSAAGGQANVVSNFANPMAEARYNSSIAKNVAGNSFLNTLFAGFGAVTGAGAKGTSEGGSGGNTSGSGTYNPSIFMTAAGG